MHIFLIHIVHFDVVQRVDVSTSHCRKTFILKLAPTMSW